MAGIGIVLNPHSKQNRMRPEQMRKIAFIVGDKAACAQTQDFDHLERVAQEFKDRDIDILGISGGDGTNHKTLTTFIQVYGDRPLPKIAFLKDGTMNIIASSCGVRGSSERIIANLIYKYHEDVPFETMTLRPMNVNGHYGFIFGCGMIYRFMDTFYQQGALSPWLAAKILARTVGSGLVNGRFACKLFEKFDAEVWVDGKKWPFQNYSSVFAGAVSQLGLNFKAFYLVEKYPGCFHSIGISLLPRTVIRHLPCAFLGKPSKTPGLLEEPAKELVIKVAEPIMFTVDGDKYGPVSEIKVTMGPEITVIKN